MKFLHIADLHLGRLLHRYSLQEEQAEILERIRSIAAKEKPDAVLIAGDVYDRSIPPVYATQLLDQFLAAMRSITKVFVISGNHDSAERLAFLSGPLADSGVYISPAYHGACTPVTLEDEHGPVDIWLLPYLKAASVHPFFPEETIGNTSDAVACAVRHMPIDPGRRNVLVAHQFVAGGKVSDSAMQAMALEDVSVGGLDLVDAHVFAPFDYVALGHLHQPQNVGSERIRYCGTPMPYDFYEAEQEKSVTMVELAGDRQLTVRTIPLPPPRRLVERRGTFEELTADEAVRTADKDAYTHIILTDDAPIPDVINRLRQVYPRFTHLDWDNARTRQSDDFTAIDSTPQQTPLTMFESFFRRMGGTEMSADQSEYLQQLIREIWEDTSCDR